ncbi:hypothetical protein L4Z64_001197 [Pseudomonas aeruginosa]|nr:hypothetical protein [Pseudomonas aeruginosa]HCH7782745.1 hypothetical protein [Pseudomonas aeruginosa]
MTEQQHPTSQMYTEIEQAFDFFNAELFGGELKHCILTLQRSHESFGYFSRERFVKSDGSNEMVSEIALNPSFFAIHSIEFTLSVLCREMVSLHQLQVGEPGRRRYKNKQWADMMEDIGLMPSDTGKPGGKRVGEKVNHYVISGGKFDEACKKLVVDEFRLSWYDRYPPMPEANVLDAEDGGEQQAPAATLTADSAPSPSGPDLGLLTDTDEGDDDDLFKASLMSRQEAPMDGSDAESHPEGAAQDVAGAAQHLNGQKLPEQPAMKTFDNPGLDALKSLGVEVQASKKPPSRARYGCPSCDVLVWGKPGLRFRCLNCAAEPEMFRNDAGAPPPTPVPETGTDAEVGQEPVLENEPALELEGA